MSVAKDRRQFGAADGAQNSWEFGLQAICPESCSPSASLAPQKFITEALKALTPNIPIFGEELGCEGINNVSTYWLIDPIDGTTWYRLGMPIYGSLIALVHNGEPIIGTAGLPALNQLCYAAKGEGCYFYDNGKTEKIVSRSGCVTHLSQAIVTASGIHGSSTWLENGDTPWQLITIIKDAKLFKFSGDCIQHIALIRGKSDVSIDTIMKPWDSAPLIICLREAGMFVSDLYGNNKNLLQSNHLLSACNAERSFDRCF